ncbi:MAG: LacI family DNA-binding transcriptional regulator, partial [Chloroflexota bacterium]
MQKSTINDVARVAGVSKSTVSRVINNVANVDPELRERVLATMTELDYQPTRAARVLKKDLNDLIGFLVPRITDTIFGGVLENAEQLAYENKMGILAYSTTDDLDRQDMYLENLQAERPAGIILVPAPGTEPNTVASIQAQGIPVVLLDRRLNGLQADCITSDNYQGAYVGTNHLIANGFTKVATIAGLQTVSSGVERLNGYRFAMANAQLEVPPEWITYGGFDVDQSYAALKNLMQLKNRPHALFVANDDMMIGVLYAIRDLRIQVPEELAIVGFDEISLADLLSPRLTTVEQSVPALGQEALRLLLDRIHQPDRAVRTIQIPTRLNVRESSGRRAGNK